MAPDDTAPPEPQAADAPSADPAMAALLTRRYGRLKKALGSEPGGLEEIARYLDGDLDAARKAAVEARLAAEPELAEVVAELGRVEDDARAQVLPLRIPEGRRMRVGGAVGTGGLRPLPMPERKRSGLSLAMTGIGAALALAAIMFLVTRPPQDKAKGSLGAGQGGKSEAIAIGFEPSGQRGAPTGVAYAVIEVEATQGGELAVLVATPAGTRAAGLCEAKECLVTHDTTALRAGKNTVRAVLAKPGEELGACAFVLALTAERADPHAAAKALGTVVSASCVLEPIAQLQGVSGARHVAFMQVPR